MQHPDQFPDLISIINDVGGVVYHQQGNAHRPCPPNLPIGVTGISQYQEGFQGCHGAGDVHKDIPDMILGKHRFHRSTAGSESCAVQGNLFHLMVLLLGLVSCILSQKAEKEKGNPVCGNKGKKGEDEPNALIFHMRKV